MNKYEIVFEANGIEAALTLEAETKDHAANLFSRIFWAYQSRVQNKPFGAKFAEDLLGRQDKAGHVLDVRNIEKI